VGSAVANEIGKKPIDIYERGKGGNAVHDYNIARFYFYY
jgi:hypothetical protein